MTRNDAFDKIATRYCQLAQKCVADEQRQMRGEIPLSDFVVTCFLLVYTAVEITFTAEPECDSAADVVAHNIRALAEHITKVKSRILEMEGGMPKTANGRLVIEARWREAIDWLVDEFGDTVLVDEIHGETCLPHELEADFLSFTDGTSDALAFYRGEIRFKPIKEKYYRLDGRAGWMWNISALGLRPRLSPRYARLQNKFFGGYGRASGTASSSIAKSPTSKTVCGIM